MTDLQHFAIAFALSQALLSAVLLFRRGCWRAPERLYALLLLCVSGYLGNPFAEGTGWAALTATLQTGVPGVFWLFSAALFDDRFRLRTWQCALVGITVVCPLLYRTLANDVPGPPRLLLVNLPQLLEFVLLGLTLTVVVRHWQADLVAARRELRLWFCGFTGSYILILILLREVVYPGEAWLASLQYLPLGVLLLVVNSLLFEFRNGLFGATTPAAVAIARHAANDDQLPAAAVPQQVAGPAATDRVLLDRIEAAMADGAYREMGLTIGGLAQQLGVKEYLLRQAINAGLGHRNFNDFLNRYRIEDASLRLQTESELPVLSVALDAGYRSLSSFNKAFKAQHAMTPTEWRRQAGRRHKSGVQGVNIAQFVENR